MSLFKKKTNKTTEEKFEHEKKERALITILRMLTAEKIMRTVCPELEKGNKDVFRALVDSLKWRGSIELKRTLEAVEKTPPEKRKLRGRESCVFIETEDTVHYVG